ncbi:MAG TPA: hypothetical protein VFL57_08180, partial [Bryobacteraceae bacterium]|nr:hypothetical protein [Bryobacteraceae bacterium]
RPKFAMRRVSLLVTLAAGLGCGHRDPAQPQMTVGAGQVGSAPSWSPDRSCVAVVVSDAAGHSPMTTTYVAVARAGDSRYRELRLPPPDERFSTFLDKWEGPGVLRIRATTLDGEVAARYRCGADRVEVLR